ALAPPRSAIRRASPKSSEGGKARRLPSATGIDLANLLRIKEVVHMKRMIVVVTAALMLAAVPAFAQAKKARASAKGPSDQTFVMDAAQGGMAEVELGKLAADKASNDDVKKFGQRMADDHGKANDELKTLAANKNITLPTDLDARDKALRDRLSKLSGPAFDRAYMQAMVNDHVKDVGAFKRES